MDLKHLSSRWPAIALQALVLATIIALALTAPLTDGAAWWQAILSGVALLGGMLFWRLDKQIQAASQTASALADETVRLTKFRSITIIVLDDVLTVDSWVRELVRRDAGPDDLIEINKEKYPIVRTIPEAPKLLAEVPNLFHLGADAEPLQHALFRFVQLANLLREAHDPTAKVQSDFKITTEQFQTMLGMITADFGKFLSLTHVALWDDKKAAEEFAARRAGRIAAGPPEQGAVAGVAQAV